MLTIEYDAYNGVFLPDGIMSDWVKKTIDEYKSHKNSSTWVSVANEVLINHFRLAVVRDEIHHTDIEFEFKGQKLSVNKHAKLSSWPDGFGGDGVKIARELIQFRISTE